MRQLPAREPGEPDNRSATRYMMWVWREQWRSQLTGMFWGVAWMLALALMPAMIGRAIDEGLLQRSTSGLLTWAGVVMGLAVFTGVAGGMRHRSALTNWLSAAYVTIQVTSRHSVRVGADLPRLIASGDVLAIGTTDVESLGNSFDIWARLSGGFVSTIVVAIIMLTTSVPLGLVVLIGVPVMMACTVVLLRPLRRRQDAYRELQGDLSDQTVDIAQGIRILRGIGGEDAFSARYAAGSQRLRGIGINAARIESLLAGQEVLLPGLLTALVTWLAAHFALHGEITLGQLVAFYGYASFLVLPLSFFGEAADEVTRGHVAAERVVKLLRLNSPIKEPESPTPPPPNGAELADPASGLTIPSGKFVAVACNDPNDAETLANRLARYVDVVEVEVDGTVDDEQPRPTFGGIPLSNLSVAVVRKRILLAANDDRIFAGTLRQTLSGTTTAPDELIQSALHAASAEDIVDALDQGLDTQVEEKGRNFSGGQLQRLRLARALVADPEILLAVEATSAVDAHTEARIAERIGAHRAHHGDEGTPSTRTTVLFTTSPLVLDYADVVAYIEDEKVLATGTHADLLSKQRGYRALVTRGEDEPEAEAEPDESERHKGVAAADTDTDANDGDTAANADQAAATDASVAAALDDARVVNNSAAAAAAPDDGSSAEDLGGVLSGGGLVEDVGAALGDNSLGKGSSGVLSDGGLMEDVGAALGDSSLRESLSGVLGGGGLAEDVRGVQDDGDSAEDLVGVLGGGGLAEDVGGVLGDGGLAEDLGGVLSDSGLAEGVGDVGVVLGDAGLAGDADAVGRDSDRAIDRVTDPAVDLSIDRVTDRVIERDGGRVVDCDVDAVESTGDLAADPSADAPADPSADLSTDPPVDVSSVGDVREGAWRL